MLPQTVINKRFISVKLLEDDEKLKSLNNASVVLTIDEIITLYLHK